MLAAIDQRVDQRVGDRARICVSFLDAHQRLVAHALEVGGGEGRLGHHGAEQLQPGFGVIARQLDLGRTALELTRRRQLGAELRDRVGERELVHRPGALVEQIPGERGEPRVFGDLLRRARAHHDARGHQRQRVVLDDEHGQAVLQAGALHGRHLELGHRSGRRTRLAPRLIGHDASLAAALAAARGVARERERHRGERQHSGEARAHPPSLVVAGAALGTSDAGAGAGSLGAAPAGRTTATARRSLVRKPLTAASTLSGVTAR